MNKSFKVNIKAVAVVRPYVKRNKAYWAKHKKSGGSKGLAGENGKLHLTFFDEDVEALKRAKRKLTHESGGKQSFISTVRFCIHEYLAK